MTDHSVATTAGYVVRLSDCSSVTIAAADDVTSRHDGSLWLLQHINPDRSALPRTRPLVVLAAGQWSAVWAADSPSPFGPPPMPPPAESTRPPRLLAQAADIADPLGRREVVAERLAQFES